jgi:uncharacterized membrane protein
MQYLDAIPIILAIIAVYVSAVKYQDAKLEKDKIRLLIGILIAIVLIIAETSLFVSTDILTNVSDSSFASKLWLFFDSVVMLLVIFYPTGKCDDTNQKSSSI